MLRLGLIDLDGNTTGNVTGGALNVHEPEHGTMLPQMDHSDMHNPGAGKQSFDKLFQREVENRMKGGKISKEKLLEAKEAAKAEFPQLQGKPAATDPYPGRNDWRWKKLIQILQDEKEAAKKYGPKIVSEAKERKRIAGQLNDAFQKAAKTKGSVSVVLKRGGIFLGTMIFVWNVRTQGVEAACNEAGRDALGPVVDLAEFVAGEIDPHVREMLRAGALSQEEMRRQASESRVNDIRNPGLLPPLSVRPNRVPPGMPAKKGYPLVAEAVTNTHSDGSALPGEMQATLSIAPAQTLRTGVIFVSLETAAASQVDRVQDALTFLSQDLARFGVVLTAAPAGSETTADIRIRIASTSPCGSAADGVLECTEGSGDITILQGWNWYTGDVPSEIASDQYDFQTVLTHEMGHALGFDHSHDTASVMYGALTTGVARRTLGRNDLDISPDRVRSDSQSSHDGSALGQHHGETSSGACDCSLCSTFRNETLCVPNGTETEPIHPSNAEGNVGISSSLRSSDGDRYANHRQFVNPEYVIEPMIRADGPYAFSLSEEENAVGARPDDVLVAGDGDDLQLGEPGRDVLVGAVAVACKSESTGENRGALHEKPDAWDVDFSIRDLFHENPVLRNCLGASS